MYISQCAHNTSLYFRSRQFEDSCITLKKPLDNSVSLIALNVFKLGRELLLCNGPGMFEIFIVFSLGGY